MTESARKHQPKDGSGQAATIPAPPSTDQHEHPPTMIESGYPIPPAEQTRIPSYSVEPLATSSLEKPETDGRAQLPLEDAVPIRRRASSVDGAPLRAAFLLSHVDGRMSITEIATSAQIPLADAIECFTLLADLGLVELRAASFSTPPGENSRPPTLKSGLHPKT